jgi:hypothetical protein
MHLLGGTHADNMADKLARGRQAYGAQIGLAKLTDEAVVLIRQLYPRYSQEYLARAFGVTRNAIYQIIARETWRHVEEAA